MVNTGGLPILLMKLYPSMTLGFKFPLLTRMEGF